MAQMFYMQRDGEDMRWKSKYMYCGVPYESFKFLMIPQVCERCEHSIWLEVVRMVKTYHVDSGGDTWSDRKYYCKQCDDALPKGPGRL